jgi:hypothetical protein
MELKTRVPYQTQKSSREWLLSEDSQDILTSFKNRSRAVRLRNGSSNPGRGNKCLSSLKRQHLPTDSLSFIFNMYQWPFPGGWGLSTLGVKLTTDLHFGREVQNEWSYTSIPQYAFVTCTGVSFTFQVKTFCSSSRPRISGSVRTSPRLCNISPQPASPSSYAQLTPSFFFSTVLST